MRAFPICDLGEAIKGLVLRRCRGIIFDIERAVPEEMSQSMASSASKGNVLIIKRLGPFFISVGKSDRLWQSFIQADKNTDSSVGYILTRFGFFCCPDVFSHPISNTLKYSFVPIFIWKGI